MKNYLKKLDNKLFKQIRIISKSADKENYRAYVVGGIVRDIFLKKDNQDLDVLIEGDAHILADDLKEKLKAKAVFHARFKTATLHLKSGQQIDFSSARKENYPYPGALPVIQKGTLLDDIRRRDFTINALAISINQDSFGEMIDKCGGLEDLRQKKIRVFHDQSFRDDPTRILRAIRFEQRFNFSFERRTAILIKEAIQTELYDAVKPQRYFTEFRKLLTEADPLKCLRRLHHFKGLRFLYPDLVIDMRYLQKIDKRLEAIKKRNLSGVLKNYGFLYFLGLIKNADERTLDDMMIRFSMTRQEKKCLKESKKVSDLLAAISPKNLKRSEIYDILNGLCEETIFYLLTLAPSGDVEQKIERFLNRDRHVKLIVNGEIFESLRVSSGTRIGKYLRKLHAAKIDGLVKDKRQEKKFLKELVNQ